MYKSTTGWFRLGGQNELDIVKSCQAVTFTAAIDACGVASQWQRGLVLLSKLGKDLSVGNLHEFTVDCGFENCFGMSCCCHRR